MKVIQRAVIALACSLFLLASVPCSEAHADDNPGYDLLFIGYQVFSNSIDAGGENNDISGLNQNLPTIWGTGFYDDFYYKANWGYGLAALFDFLGAGSTGQFGKDDTLYRQSGFLILSDLEFGPHWRIGPGLLSTGLSVDILTFGAGQLNLTDGNVTGGTGGTAFEAGLALGYTMPVAGFLRVNPSATYSASTLAGVNDNDFTGTSAKVDVEVIAKLLDWFSVTGNVGHDLRNFSPTDKSPAQNKLSFNSTYLWVGVAFHGDEWGIGENEF